MLGLSAGTGLGGGLLGGASTGLQGGLGLGSAQTTATTGLLGSGTGLLGGTSAAMSGGLLGGGLGGTSTGLATGGLLGASAGGTGLLGGSTSGGLLGGGTSGGLLGGASTGGGLLGGSTSGGLLGGSKPGGLLGGGASGGLLGGGTGGGLLGGNTVNRAAGGLLSGGLLGGVAGQPGVAAGVAVPAAMPPVIGGWQVQPADASLFEAAAPAGIDASLTAAGRMERKWRHIRASLSNNNPDLGRVVFDERAVPGGPPVIVPATARPPFLTEAAWQRALAKSPSSSCSPVVLSGLHGLKARVDSQSAATAQFLDSAAMVAMVAAKLETSLDRSRQRVRDAARKHDLLTDRCLRLLSRVEQLLASRSGAVSRITQNEAELMAQLERILQTLWDAEQGVQARVRTAQDVVDATAQNVHESAASLVGAPTGIVHRIVTAADSMAVDVATAARIVQDCKKDLDVAQAELVQSHSSASSRHHHHHHHSQPHRPRFAFDGVE